MIFPVMNSTIPRCSRHCCAEPRSLCAAAALAAQKKAAQSEKPMAGPRATALRVTWLYISARPRRAKSRPRADRPRDGGRRKERPLAARLRQHRHRRSNTPATRPIFGTDETPPPISGWMQAKGVVIENTPNGDQILMGAAANQEALASDPRGPANAAHSARLLYRRLVEMFPNSPLVPEAAWRAADILWQIQKADASSRPSAKEQTPYMREQMDEDGLKQSHQVLSAHAEADLAAYELIDNKLCGDWQGQRKVSGERIRDLREVCRRASRRPAHRAGSLPGRLPPRRAHRHVRRRQQRQKERRCA